MSSRIRFSLSTLLSLCLALSLIIPTARAQQKPDQKDDVIRIAVDLVQTDVTVLDKGGRFVDGLRPEQFELLVDGKPQSISFFEQVTAGSRREAAIVEAREGARAGVTDKPAADSRSAGRTVFFFVDDLHLSPDSMRRTRDALQKFVSENMGANDQVAITSTTGQLGFLQQLTNSKLLLTLAIERLKPRTRNVIEWGDPPMTEYHAYAIEQGQTDVKEIFVELTCSAVLKLKPNVCSGAGMTNNAVLDEVNTRSDKTGSGGGNRTTTSMAATGAAGNRERWRAEDIVKSRARGITRQAAQSILGTLSSLESLVRRAAPLPERKLVVFVSEGFYINFVSSTQVYDLRRMTDAATRTGTVIYTVDARGLSSGVTDATRSGSFDPSGRLARVNLQEVRAAQQPLVNLAAETGGEAWLNSNDLSKGITKAINETSAYYLLAWRPESTEIAKDRFRRIEVRVKGRPDLSVRVRSGFFAEDPTVSKAGNSSDTTALSVDDQLIGAIRASYPRAGIPLVLSLGYLDKAEEGLMLAASVQIEREAGVAGEKESQLDVMGAVIDDGGNILSSLKQNVTILANQSANAKTLVVTFQFPKIAPGLRQVRIAARDSRSGRIGSLSQWIELPNLSKEGLTLSSIFLTEGGANNSSQKVTIKPDARFTKTERLRFQTHVYNAATSGSGSSLTMQVELRHNGQMLTQTPASPVPTEGVKDLARIPVIGEFPLENFPSGQYELKVAVTDPATKKTASQTVSFVIQ